MSWLGSLIQGAAGLISGGISSSAQNSANNTNWEIAKYNAQAQKDLAEYQNAYNLEMWNKENEYNTPAAQMQRYQDAGLNPNLIYGQGNSGNASSVPQAATYNPSLNYQKQPNTFGNSLAQTSDAFVDSLFKMDQLKQQHALNKARISQIETQNAYNKVRTEAQLASNLSFSKYNDERQTLTNKLLSGKISLQDAQTTNALRSAAYTDAKATLLPLDANIKRDVHAMRQMELQHYEEDRSFNIMMRSAERDLRTKQVMNQIANSGAYLQLAKNKDSRDYYRNMWEVSTIISKYNAGELSYREAKREYDYKVQHGIFLSRKHDPMTFEGILNMVGQGVGVAGQAMQFMPVGKW